VNRIRTRLDSDANDIGNIQVGVDGTLAIAHQITLVRLGPVQRKAVFVGMNRDRRNAELSGGPHHANGYFTAVRDQQSADRTRLAEGFHCRSDHSARDPRAPREIR
jgi:hypothetical protein